jgi:lipoyl-dependent peroxiredoxin
MSYKPLYTAVATALSGRDGHVETSDSVLNLNLSVPKEMGGPGKAGATNPEQLFASGYAACFGGAVAFVAGQKKIAVKDVKVTARVTFGTTEEGAFQLAAELDVHVPNVDQATAEELVQAAHQVCPYSRATRNNIEVKIATV